MVAGIHHRPVDSGQNDHLWWWNVNNIEGTREWQANCIPRIEYFRYDYEKQKTYNSLIGFRNIRRLRDSARVVPGHASQPIVFERTRAAGP